MPTSLSHPLSETELLVFATGVAKPLVSFNVDRQLLRGLS